MAAMAVDLTVAPGEPALPEPVLVTTVAVPSAGGACDVRWESGAGVGRANYIGRGVCCHFGAGSTRSSCPIAHNAIGAACCAGGPACCVRSACCWSIIKKRHGARQKNVFI